MERVFISYRRADSQWPADRIYETLNQSSQNPDFEVFIDVDGIPLGMDFHEHLESKVAQCDVLLALIGHGWLDAKDAETGERRLDDPNDFVRIEIAAALKRNIPVVPVLLDGAREPNSKELPEDLKPLSRRNGVEIRRISFKTDIERLVKGLGLGEQKNVLPIEPANEKTKKLEVQEKREIIASSTEDSSSSDKQEKVENRISWAEKQSAPDLYDEKPNRIFGKAIALAGLLLASLAVYLSYEKYRTMEVEKSKLELNLAAKGKLNAKLVKEKAVREKALIDLKLAKEREERELLAQENSRKRLEKEAADKRFANASEQKRLAEELERKRLDEKVERRRTAEINQQNLLTQETEKKRLALEAEKKRQAEDAKRVKLAKAEREKFAFGTWTGMSGNGKFTFAVELGKEDSTYVYHKGKLTCRYKLIHKTLMQDLKIGDEARFITKKAKGSFWSCEAPSRVKINWINTNEISFITSQLGIKMLSAQLTRSE